MKKKLRIEELSVASFSTEEEDLARKRGTVRGLSGDMSFGTCPGEATCGSCNLRTCADTCGSTCTCPAHNTCLRTCSFTGYDSCPDLETCGMAIC